MTELRFVDAIRSAIADEMQADERVIVMGEEVGALGGVFTATRDLIDVYGSERVLDSPLAEASLMGFALGAATEGFRPIVEIMFSDFVMIAMDQIVNHAAKLRYMSRGQFSVPLVVRLPGGAGTNHGPQHSQSLESWFAHVPGLVVAMPSNAEDAYWMLRHAVRLDDPVIFLENKALYFTPAAEVSSEPSLAPLSARVSRSGADLTIVSIGRMVPRCLEAADMLATEGHSVEVIDLRYLWPMDIKTVLDSVEKTSHLMVVSEAVEFCGWSGEVASQVALQGFEMLDAPIRRVGSLRSPIPVGVHLEEHIVPTSTRILEEARLCLAY